jgi:dienelactone hydrolase
MIFRPSMKKAFRKRGLHLFTATTVIVGSAAFLGCAHATGDAGLDPAVDPAFENYRFPTRNVSGFRELVTEPPIPNAEGIGRLYLPEGASRSGPVPLMVILHGSGGTRGGRGARHARFLRQNGIGALVVDTFSGRGLGEKDKYIPRLMEANFPDQLSDAFGALAALQGHPLVDGARIGVMGYSMGGSSAILAAYENIAAACAGGSERFALHVAFYASCIVRPRDGSPTGAPVVALWGEEDGATPKSGCEGFLRDFEEAGVPVRTKWYEGASHGWNGLVPAQFYGNVPNFAPCEFVVQENGQVAEKKTGRTSDTDRQVVETSEHCVDYGYAIGRHDPTNDLADAELLEAIRRHLADE